MFKHSWEMSTIGHPLSDVSNLLSPYTFAVDPPNSAMSSRTNPAFSPSANTGGLPTRSQCVEWYREVVVAGGAAGDGGGGWDPTPKELGWGDVFANFRNSVIMQGIAARYALRQASSAQAREIGGMMGPYGEFSWGLVERWKRKREKNQSQDLGQDQDDEDQDQDQDQDRYQKVIRNPRHKKGGLAAKI